MDFRSILNKGKEYAGKMKDSINKTIEEANQKKALIEEKVAKADSLTKEKKEIIESVSLDKEQQLLYEYLLNECKMNINENINSLIALIVSKNEVVLASTTLTDKTSLETYNLILSNQYIYIIKESSYIKWDYTNINKIEILDRGVINATLELNSYVVILPTNVLDTIMLFLTKEDNRKQWKTNIQNNFLEYKRRLLDDNSAIGMEKKVLQNGLNMTRGSEWLRTNFTLIEKGLQDNEHVIYPFVGMLNYRTNTDPGEAYAFALTTNRLLYASKGIMGDNFFAVPREQLTGITMDTTSLNGVITIHTTIKNLIVGIASERALFVCNYLKEQLDKKNEHQEKKIENGSITDELIKLKSLLDSGAITQEEFEQGKAKLLG